MHGPYEVPQRYRALFPPDCFRQKKLSGIAVQHLQCKTKDKLTNKVIVHNEEGALLTSWLEEGVFDALHQLLRGSLPESDWAEEM